MAATFVSTLLFGLQPHDPLTIAMAATVLLIVGGAAGGSLREERHGSIRPRSCDRVRSRSKRELLPPERSFRGPRERWRWGGGGATPPA